MTAKARSVEVEMTTICVCNDCGDRIRRATRWEETPGEGWAVPRPCDTCGTWAGFGAESRMRFFRWTSNIIHKARFIVSERA